MSILDMLNGELFYRRLLRTAMTHGEKKGEKSTIFASAAWQSSTDRRRTFLLKIASYLQ
jgi:hypothetical protein